jgi:hypothetical protein
MKWKFNTLFKVEEIHFNLSKKMMPIESKFGLLSKNIESLKSEVNLIKKDDLKKVYEKINSLENKMKEMEINIKKEIKTEIDNYFKEIKNNKKIFGEES